MRCCLRIRIDERARLIFRDLPCVVSPALYDDAIQLYAQKVQPRAASVYRVGNIRFAGLSDIDLLVVTSAARADNNQFFSVTDRLPQLYQRLFLHEPFIVPESILEVIRHTSHGQRQLICGEDILSALQPDRTLEERWCKLLESYCNTKAFLSQFVTHEIVSAKMTIAVANSMRYALSDWDEIADSHYSPAYGDEIDQLRTNWLQAPDTGNATAAQALHLLQSKTDWLTSQLVKVLPLGTEQLLDFCREFLQGRRRFGDLRCDDIADRKTTIDRYHSELLRMKFSYGYLFFLAAYGRSISPYHQPLVSKAYYKLIYRGLSLTGK